VNADRPSADTIGYCLERFDLEVLRDELSRVAHLAKRKKAIRQLPGSLKGYWIAALDGHELVASRKRCCCSCLVRTVKTAQGPVMEYYHQAVFLQLVHADPPLILDMELILPGEGEVAAAMRILDRVRIRYPRFFEVLTLDALYLQAPFIKKAMQERFHLIVVLKQEARELFQDAQGLIQITCPTLIQQPKEETQLWDLVGLTSWKNLGLPVRVIRSVEKKEKRVRIARRWSQKVTQTEWFWVSTLPTSIESCFIARWGHARWDIENRGFNELHTHWAMDHCFRHQTTAILAFLMVLALAFALTTFFFGRNLKPQIRTGRTRLFLAGLFLSGLLEGQIKSFFIRSP
jgi:hypothetical protein